MSAQDQSSAESRLQYETRVRPRAGVVAGLAGVSILVASLMQLVGPHSSVNELTLELITANKRLAIDLVASVINSLGSLAIAVTLVFLFDSARARNPAAQPWIKPLAIAGGLLAAVSGIAYAVVIAIKAHQFATTGNQTYVEAHHLTSATGVVVLQVVGQLAALLLAVSFVLVSLNALRVGLLTRFMGYLGLFAGVLVLFQITQVPIVQAYWLLAVGYLLWGRWPSGTPPAWTTGRAEKWPSSQELREQRMKAGGRGKPVPAGRAKPVPAAETAGAPADTGTRPAVKRKRKRRK